MSSRKAFVIGVGVASAAALAPSASVQGMPSPSPSPTATPAPSLAAHAFAVRMRAFDPSLTDAQIDTIAQGIDQGFDAGKTMRKHRALHNGDAPVPEFEVGE